MFVDICRSRIGDPWIILANYPEASIADDDFPIALMSCLDENVLLRGTLRIKDTVDIGDQTPDQIALLKRWFPRQIVLECVPADEDVPEEEYGQRSWFRGWESCDETDDAKETGPQDNWYLTWFHLISEEDSRSDELGHVERIHRCRNPKTELGRRIAEFAESMRHALAEPFSEADRAGVVKQAGRESEWVPSEVQRLILTALDGHAFTAEALAEEIRRSKSTIGKHPGGIKELMEQGAVKNDRVIGGYYRPDRPPSVGGDQQNWPNTGKVAY